MASKHKAPTAVTIASTEAESDFQEFVQRHWKTGLTIFLAAAAGVLLLQYRRSQSRAAVDASWDRLGEVVSFQGMAQPQSPQALADMARELDGKDAAPWAKALEVGAFLREDDFQGAQTALNELETGWPQHDLVRLPWPDGLGETAPLPQQLRSRIEAMKAWEEAHPSLRENPPLPEDAPRVQLTTSAGNIVLGLYSDKAPRHVENFLKLCRAGYYDGTRFHRVIAGFMVQGGDPNSRNADAPETWGLGGPDEKIPAELTDLKHFPYVLAAAKTGADVDSSGSQFYVTLAAAHHLDGQHTVFGKVLEGQDVVDAIGAGSVTGDRPDEPVVIESTQVL